MMSIVELLEVFIMFLWSSKHLLGCGKSKKTVHDELKKKQMEEKEEKRQKKIKEKMEKKEQKEKKKKEKQSPRKIIPTDAPAAASVVFRGNSDNRI